MPTEDAVADVLSRMRLLAEDLPDARTKQQKAMWAIDAVNAMDGAFALINELLVEREALKRSKDNSKAQVAGAGYQPIATGGSPAPPPRGR